MNDCPEVQSVEALFDESRRRGRKVLIGYLTAGFPDKNRFLPLVLRLANSGVDLLELGVPFSDPIADGPTIQHASFRALRMGVSLTWIFKQVSRLRRHQGLRTPIVLMSYCNPILAMGTERFSRQASRAGVQGVILPDLIPEEGAQFENIFRKHGLSLIYLVAPTTPKARQRWIAQRTHGFLYAVALTGVTGARTQMAKGVTSYLRGLRQITPKPLAVGFGVSAPQHVRGVRQWVDGVIVGSALIQRAARESGRSFEATGRWVRGLQKALNP